MAPGEAPFTRTAVPTTGVACEKSTGTMAAPVISSGPFAVQGTKPQVTQAVVPRKATSPGFSQAGPSDSALAAGRSSSVVASTTARRPGPAGVYLKSVGSRFQSVTTILSPRTATRAGRAPSFTAPSDERSIVFATWRVPRSTTASWLEPF